MKYPEYRKVGLPVSSSLVESLIKEMNYRVKGTEKFWDNPEGAEAILQVRAALLSDDDRLASHIANRPGTPFRRSPTKEIGQAA
jgi:superfamily I DNA/RNA helicase